MVGIFDRDELGQTWNRIHREESSSEQPVEALVDFVSRLRHLPSGALVLDAGCGQGRNAMYLSGKGFGVYGCDLAPAAIAIARDRSRQAGATIHFQVTDLAHLAYPDGTFAAAVCIHVLPYLPKAEIANTLRELGRVLQPGGWLYLDLLARDDAEYGCGPALEAHTFLAPEGLPMHFSSRQEVDELLCEFQIERVTRLELGAARNRVAWAVWAMKNEEKT